MKSILHLHLHSLVPFFLLANFQPSTGRKPRTTEVTFDNESRALMGNYHPQHFGTRIRSPKETESKETEAKETEERVSRSSALSSFTSLILPPPPAQLSKSVARYRHQNYFSPASGTSSRMHAHTGSSSRSRQAKGTIKNRKRIFAPATFYPSGYSPVFGRRLSIDHRGSAAVAVEKKLAPFRTTKVMVVPVNNHRHQRAARWSPLVLSASSLQSPSIGSTYWQQVRRTSRF